MTLRAVCCGVALSLAASYAAADCENPPLAAVPTVEEAREMQQDMQALQAQVQEYHAAMTEYTSCLQAEIDEARERESSDLVQNLLVTRNNAAVSEVEAVIQQFNQLVQSIGGGEAQE